MLGELSYVEIQASALLHQKHRETREDSSGHRYLVATWEDYVNIKEVFQNIVPRVTQPAGMKYLATFRKIAWWLSKNSGSTRVDIRSQCEISKAAAEGHLKDLVEVELLALIEPPIRDRRDQKNYYQLGPRLLTKWEDIKQLARDKHLSEEELFKLAVDKAIAEIELVNKITAASDPAPSISPNENPGEVNQAPHEAPEYLPRSLEGNKQEVKFSQPLESHVDDLDLD